MRYRKNVLITLACVAAIAVSGEARGQSHGVNVASECTVPVAAAFNLDCTVIVAYNDGFGDTWEILEAWAVVDPNGHATRVPEVGSLDVLAVLGNAAATGGMAPVRIGEGSSTLAGLPGIPNPGAVVFSLDAYLVQADDPDPLEIVFFTAASDLCDEPVTEGCSSFILIIPSASSVDVIAPDIDLAVLAPICDGTAGTIEYRLAVSNPGDIDLEDVQLATDGPPACTNPVFLSGDDDPDGRLNPGETWVFGCGPVPVTLPVADLNVTVVAVDSAGLFVVEDDAVLVSPCDCNDNGISDDEDISGGTSADCDGDGGPDECEPDCNGNGVADDCDVASMTSTDCNANGVPDECEPDANGDGVIDDCDCNGNGVLDVDDLAADPDADCNGDGEIDDCVPFFFADTRWVQPAGGMFATCANWFPGRPVAPNTARFDIDFDYQVTLDRFTATEELRFNAGQVTLDLAGFDYEVLSTTSPGLVVGETAGDAAGLTVQNTGGGGEISAISGRVGSDAGALGELVVSGPAADLGLLEGLCIGCAGTGSLLIEGGASVTCRDAVVGDLVGAAGEVTLTGGGSTWTAPFFITVNRGFIDVGPGATISAGFDQFGGVFLLGDGDLRGAGTIDATVVNFGEVIPGGTAGTLTIDGDYIQVGSIPDLGPSSGTLTLAVSTGEPAPLLVLGAAELGGGLFVGLDAKADPPAGAFIPLLNASTVAGQFDVAFMPGLDGGRFLSVAYGPGGGVAGNVTEVSLGVGQLDSLLGFDDPESVMLDEEPSAVAVANFDDDAGSRDDLAVTLPAADGVSAGSIIVFYNATTDGLGQFTGFESSQQFPVGVDPAGIAAGSLDPQNDAAVDLVVANAGDNTVSVLTNDGSGGFTITATLAAGLEPRGIATGDFSGDGVADIIVVNAGDDTAIVYTNDGTADPPSETTLIGQCNPRVVDPIDVDKDRCLDAVIGNACSNTVTVLFGNGGQGGVAAFDPPVSLPVGAEPVALATGTLNGDVFPDIVTTNFADGTVSVILNNGDRTFTPAVDLDVGPAARSLAIVDLEQDGDLDVSVVATGMNGAVVRVLRNDTNQGQQLIFATAEDLDVGEAPVIVTTGDLDGDSVDDLVSVNAGAGAAAAGAATAGPVAGSLNVLLNAVAPPCPADTDGDGEVDVNDLNAVFLDWGTDGSANGGDLTGPMPGSPPDGIVNVNDLVAVFNDWGLCP